MRPCARCHLSVVGLPRASSRFRRRLCLIGEHKNALRAVIVVRLSRQLTGVLIRAPPAIGGRVTVVGHHSLSEAVSAETPMDQHPEHLLPSATLWLHSLRWSIGNQPRCSEKTNRRACVHAFCFSRLLSRGFKVAGGRGALYSAGSVWTARATPKQRRGVGRWCGRYTNLFFLRKTESCDANGPERRTTQETPTARRKDNGTWTQFTRSTFLHGEHETREREADAVLGAPFHAPDAEYGTIGRAPPALPGSRCVAAYARRRRPRRHRRN